MGDNHLRATAKNKWHTKGRRPRKIDQRELGVARMDCIATELEELRRSLRNLRKRVVYDSDDPTDIKLDNTTNALTDICDTLSRALAAEECYYKRHKKLAA